MIGRPAGVVAVKDPEVLNACTFLLVMAYSLPELEASATVAAIRAEFPEAVADAAAAFSPLSVPPYSSPATVVAASETPAAADPEAA